MNWRAASAAVAAALLAYTVAAGAQAPASYPAKPIRVVVPLAPGGNVDLVVRSLTHQIAENSGWQFIVENRPGASSLVGTQFAAKAPADGYTYLAIANTFATVPSLMSNPGYDVFRDFSAVTLTCLVPMALVVNPSLPVRTVKELIGLAKSRPGQLSYATAGVGSTGHIAGELLSRHAGIKMLHVPYKGNAQAIVDVIGGQVALMFDQISTSQPHMRAGKLRGLAVTSRQRSPLFPALPTVDESGAPGFEEITFNGLMAPANTPREMRARMLQEVARAAATPKLRDRFIEHGVELKASASPDEFGAYVKAEFDKKAKLAREANIRLD
ncbi:MAG TPA: tripartite tricarboxylate transporter substrate binding protein [Burkholderiales bacterium]|nr:tripartite tricarboxylate transporter substrate binding protein [Burkholderiales bacterium]